MFNVVYKPLERSRWIQIHVSADMTREQADSAAAELIIRYDSDRVCVLDEHAYYEMVKRGEVDVW